MIAVHEHKEPVFVATFVAWHERAAAREKAWAAAGQQIVRYISFSAGRIFHAGRERNEGGTTTTVSQRIAGGGSSDDGCARRTVLDIGGSALLVHMMLFKGGAWLSHDIIIRDAVFLAGTLGSQV